MKKIIALFLISIMMMAALPLFLAAYASETRVSGEYVLDEIIIKFFPKSMFPGKEKQYDDEVAKVLKDGLSLVTDNVYVVKSDDFLKESHRHVEPIQKQQIY